jgi:lipoic acid synthetase
MENRLPVWFKQNQPSKEALGFSNALRNKYKLNTVCHSARCPNISHCFSRNHATFMILGDRCTRRCGFCNIEKIPDAFEQDLTVDLGEPYRIAEAVRDFNLDYVVITSVTRDDLADGGAAHFAKTMQIIREVNPYTQIEVLIPDFKGSYEALEIVVRQAPDVISHNLETTKRIFSSVRHKANYRRSLDLLKNIKLINPEQNTKSSLYDLRSAYCDILVLGQYLSPSLKHYPVQKFYMPEEFKYWKDFAYNIGFRHVCSFPLARTSFPSRKEELCTM